jgi:acetyltransferase-like isoleucine patch superfamily enzyme
MVGLGAMIRDHITIGRWATIGMGSVVVKSVRSHRTVWGNPAKEPS